MTREDEPRALTVLLVAILVLVPWVGPEIAEDLRAQTDREHARALRQARAWHPHILRATCSR